MANKMKGITCCGDCAHYNWNKHRCKRGFCKEDDPLVPFFDECDLPDVRLVVHVRWMETEQPMGWDNVSCATCSVCGEDFVLDEWAIDDVRREMHYCMNCGASMDLEDDDA